MSDDPNSVITAEDLFLAILSMASSTRVYPASVTTTAESQTRPP